MSEASRNGAEPDQVIIDEPTNGRALLEYQQRLALETRGPITATEEIAKHKREKGWPEETKKEYW